MATNFSPCKRPYVLNRFPSNVMFGMNGFHVSASGAIQGHHGPLVCLLVCFSFDNGSRSILSVYFVLTLYCYFASLPLTLKGYNGARNKILFYSIHIKTLN